MPQSASMQVPEMRAALLARDDWAALAARQAAGALGPASATLSAGRARSLLRSFEFMCDLEPDQALSQVHDRLAHITDTWCT